MWWCGFVWCVDQMIGMDLYFGGYHMIDGKYKFIFINVSKHYDEYKRKKEQTKTN